MAEKELNQARTTSTFVSTETFSTFGMMTTFLRITILLLRTDNLGIISLHLRSGS